MTSTPTSVAAQAGASPPTSWE